MKFKASLLTLVGALGVSGMVSAAQPHSHATIDFSEGIPKGMYTLAENSIHLDTMRMKRGEQSLRWDWVGNDRLIYDAPVGYRKQVLVYENVDGHGGSESTPVLSPTSAFAMWIYNTKASTQRLRVQFGRGEVVDCEFDYVLNFEGWRTVLIGFDRGDMRGVPREDMDRVTLLAPSAGSGTFYIDMFNTATELNPKIAAPSAQLPDIQIHPRLVSQYESRLYENSKKRPTFNLEALTAQNVETFRAMEARVDDLYFPEYEQAKCDDSRIESIRRDYAGYNIRRDGDNIYGVPVMDGQVYEMYPDFGENNNKVREHTKTWNNDLTPLMFNIAKLYTATQSEELKEELASKFIDLFDLAYDQGMAPGESLAWIHHYSYRMRPFYPAMYYMRDVLKEAGRLERGVEVCRYYSQLNMFYDPNVVYGVEGRVATDADYLQGILSEALLTVLMQDDSAEKMRDLRHYSDYFSKVSANYASALDECLKPDGTTFHHAGHAVGYGGRALAGMVRAAYMLGAGECAVSQEVINRIKKGVVTTMLYTMGDKYSTPKAFASIRFDAYSIPKTYFTLPATLALASEGEDELASLYYQTLAEQTPDQAMIFWGDKLNERYASAPKTFNYTGTTMLPYSCVGMHRYESDWLMCVRTHNKYVYPFESWGPDFFRYPLFVGNGYLDIAYGNDLDSTTGEHSLWIDGYDWHRWPGVTSVRLPYEDMVTRPGQVRDEAGEYLFSDQAFSGGVSTSYNTGVYVFKFRGHDKFGLESFSGKKSYFFYDDMVLCLGNDICSDIDEHSVETTLFQTSTTENVKCDEAMNIKGNRGVGDKVVTSGKDMWFIDGRSSGYYVPSIDRGTKLEVSLKDQTSPIAVGEGESSGEFFSAVLNHGVKPENAAYSYIMVADADEQKMETLAKRQSSRKPVMKVVQHDSDAHIVNIDDIDATAYAIYAEDGISFKRGIVRGVNKQSTFMVREVEAGELQLSVADPDLNIYDGQDDLMPDGSRCELSIYEREWFYWKSRPNRVVITLDGEWVIKEQLLEMETAQNKQARIISSPKGKTLVEVECRDGLSSEVLLRKL